MKNKYTVSAFSDDSPGVLYRITNLFLRRKINIQSLTVSETEKEGFSRFTLVVEVEPAIIEKVVKQLYRIVEVTKVYESRDSEIIFREVALVKVHTKTPEKRREIIDISNMYNAVIAHVEDDYIMIQKSASEDKIDSLVELLRPYGIKEIVRSGRVALRK